jgi:hypothetical protein
MRKELQCHIEGGGGGAADGSPKNTPWGNPMTKNTPCRDPLIKNCSCGDPMISTKYMVVLAPMEIKTFLIEFWIVLVNMSLEGFIIQSSFWVSCLLLLGQYFFICIGFFESWLGTTISGSIYFLELHASTLLYFGIKISL